LNRYFVDKRLTDPAMIDLDASELRGILRISECSGRFLVEQINFDFSIDIAGPHRANNRVHTIKEIKDRIDGFVANVVKPGVSCREVDEAEFDAIHQRLLEKSDHMRKKKRRKQVITESDERAPRPRLP
jgi:hypothetical protein